MRYFGVIWNRISDPLEDLSGSRCIKETNESMTRVDSSVPLVHHDLSELGLLILILIQITLKERILRHVIRHVANM